ncbi:hypothetical protein GOB49_03315 [Sinorhizobium meliloti]|nr:hypothetical protein [Sinorhizobium meliloti]MDX0173434.1 hypothetical protein [Sinorhizobium meliloti]
MPISPLPSIRIQSTRNHLDQQLPSAAATGNKSRKCGIQALAGSVERSFTRWSTAVIISAIANGFSSIMLFGTPLIAHSAALSPLM